jgi:hypothetical protein
VNYFISYPRSGAQWTQKRMRFFLEHFANIKLGEIYDRSITYTHYGFTFFNPGTKALTRPSFTKNDKLFILFRDARKSIVSYFYYLRRRQPSLLEKICCSSPEDFVYGIYGVSRFNSYLNKIERYRDLAAKTSFIFYEDAMSLDFIKLIPSIMEVDYNLSDEEANKIIEEFPFSLEESFSSHEKDAEYLNYIQKYLLKNCFNLEYRDKYLVSG